MARVPPLRVSSLGPLHCYPPNCWRCSCQTSNSTSRSEMSRPVWVPGRLRPASRPPGTLSTWRSGSAGRAHPRVGRPCPGPGLRSSVQVSVAPPPAWAPASSPPPHVAGLGFRRVTKPSQPPSRGPRPSPPSASTWTRHLPPRLRPTATPAGLPLVGPGRLGSVVLTVTTSLP